MISKAQWRYRLIRWIKPIKLRLEICSPKNLSPLAKWCEREKLARWFRLRKSKLDKKQTSTRWCHWMGDENPKMHALIKGIALVDINNRKGCIASTPENQNQVLIMHESMWIDDMCACVCIKKTDRETEKTSGGNCCID